MSTRLQPNSYMSSQLFWLRWMTLAALLLLTLARPTFGRVGIPAWSLILLFAAYNFLIGLLQKHFMVFYAAAWAPILDLPAAALIYYLGAAPDGPLFVLFLLITGCAATSMPMRAAMGFTGVTAILIIAIMSMSPQWSADTQDIIELGVHLIVLGLVGVGTALFTRRLTQARAANRGYQDMVSHWETLEQLRSQFIAAISHDLRTPLTSIKAGIGLAATSASDRLRANEKDMLQTALRNVERLRMMIDDLLAFNQIEAGAMQIEHESVDLRAVVNDALAIVSPLMEEKRQRLDVHLPEPLPTCGDFKRLTQVVVNVLANAHYHTPAGAHVTLTGAHDNGEILLVVRDDGPGISEEELESIFLHFHRFSSADGRSGLGLAIARDIITLHQGRIWAESQPGHGTTFYIILPEEMQR